MATKTVSSCTGCADIFGGCLGRFCPNASHEVTICDSCGQETEDIYDCSGMELCRECWEKEEDVIYGGL